MTDSQEPPMTPYQPPPPPPVPYRYPPPPPPRRGPSMFRILLAIVSLLVLAGLLVVFGFVVGLFASGASGTLSERHYAGKTSAHNKIAIVKIDGVLMEGRTSYAEKQIEQAAKDNDVKAVIVRIDSPGGSITASDDLYRRLTKLRDGDSDNDSKAKPLVVSMGGIAASGGYYIAMAAKKNIVAESTTITGSIGVYAALPDLHKGMEEELKIKMNVIKAGDQKDGGSPFAALGEKDHDIIQNMVDHAYLRFIEVVEDGRPDLKGKLQESITLKESLAVRHGEERTREYSLDRYRADGGIFTADQAKKYDLIDDIGGLDTAIERAAKVASVSDYNVVQYDRPPTLFGSLLGIKTPTAPMQLDADGLSRAATLRVWYLAPQSEIAGLIATTGKE